MPLEEFLKKEGTSMKNVKQIAQEINPSNFNSQKVRQRIRDEIKRQQIEVKKDSGKIVIADKDAESVVKALKKERYIKRAEAGWRRRQARF